MISSKKPMIEHKIKERLSIHQTICEMIIPDIRTGQKERMNQMSFQNSHIPKRSEISYAKFREPKN
jgi:hypothetical protein